MYILFLIVLIIIFLAYINGKGLFQSPEITGMIGENRTAYNIALLMLSDKPSAIFRNIYVTDENGNTSEIDIVYVNTKGIFVIENKNYKGYIFGHDNNREWTVTLYAGKDFWGNKHSEKHRFYNPVRQNKTHIIKLRKFLNIDAPFYSIIVFDDRCNLMDVTTSGDVSICYSSDIRKVIKCICEKKEDVLTEEEIQNISEEIHAEATRSKEKKDEHIKNINRVYGNSLKCPVCGRKLILRTASKGKYAGKQFYGCSNYPKCRYILNIDDKE